MRLTNMNPTETSLGASHQRDVFLGQEARNSRVVRRVRTIARLVFVLLAVSIVAAIVVGPSMVIGWVGTYLIPVGLVVGVLGVVFVLFLWWGGKFYDMMYPRN